MTQDFAAFASEQEATRATQALDDILFGSVQGFALVQVDSKGCLGKDSTVLLTFYPTGVALRQRQIPSAGVGGGGEKAVS